MNILLTGATGVIGREVLFELLLHSIKNQLDHKILCISRNSHFLSANKRIQELLTSFSKEQCIPEQEVTKLVHIIDISNDVPRSYSSLILYLKKSEIKNLRVIHLASTVNLSTSPAAEDEVYTQSYLSTMDLLERLSPYIKQFSFISTAYSCGHQRGLIPSDYFRLEIKANRNYYERFKLEAERKIRQFCESKGIIWQIIRPSMVCGRLLKLPYYYMPKFTMFYEWTRFFYDLSTVGVNIKGFRVKANPRSGINIVPSDYVAKAIVRAFYETKILEINIANSQNLPIGIFLSTILKSVGTKDFQMVDDKPSMPTVAEKLYYDTIGKAASPYLHTPEHQFDTVELRELMHDVPEPDVVEHFEHLLTYAIQREFAGETL